LTPTFARAEYRKAKIYETQKNWEVYTENLNKTISMDPKFAPAYYELYFYNLYRQKYDEADDFAKKYIANSDADVQTDYLRAQTLWAKKDYDGAIGILKNIVSKAGDKTKPRTYKLLAYSYADKGDTASAKDYVDQYFAKATDEDVIAQDWILKGAIYGTLTKDDNIVLQSIEKALSLDTVYNSRWDLLQSSYDAAKTKGNKCLQGSLALLMYKTRKVPYQFDLFTSGQSYYSCGAYQKADSVFGIYNTNYADSIYGWFWTARTNMAQDTSLSVEPFLSNMVNGFKKALTIAGTAKDRYKTYGIQSSQFLAAIYNNTKKDRDSAIFFVQKGLEFDPTNAPLTQLLQILQKRPAPARSGTPAKTNGGSKPSALNKPDADKTSTGATKK